jgi:hypothetical protein
MDKRHLADFHTIASRIVLLNQAGSLQGAWKQATQYFLFLHLLRRNPPEWTGFQWNLQEWTGIPVDSAGMDRNPQE